MKRREPRNPWRHCPTPDKPRQRCRHFSDSRN